MAKKNKSNAWVKKHVKDPFVRKSKVDKYRSRAAYKLKAIDEKFSILKNISSVIDLGCAPGSWLQVLKEYKNIEHIIALDVLDLEPVDGVRIYNQDIRDEELLDKIFVENNIVIDLVLSDIAPNITGISDVDQSNFIEIANDILSFCRLKLKPRGTMIMKYFLGINFDDTMQMLNLSLIHI